MIKAVIFDVDGTLIDSVEVHAKAWLWAFARHGHDLALTARSAASAARSLRRSADEPTKSFSNRCATATG